MACNIENKYTKVVTIYIKLCNVNNNLSQVLRLT
jgi:hypothetical protein